MAANDYDDEEVTLEVWDIVIIVAHFMLVLGLGIWSSFKSNRGTTSGYFLAGRDMSWWLVGMSLYVSNIGSSSFIGLSGSASSSGYAVVAYEFHGIFCLVLLGFIFVPVYFASGIYTIPEYLKKRFGGNRLRWVLAILLLFSTVIIGVSAEMYAGTIIIQQVLGWNLYLSVCLLLAMAAIYTVAGGLTAVIYTDALQTVIMLIGAFILMGIGLNEIGGMENLKLAYMTAVPNTTQLSNETVCGVPTQFDLHIFRPLDDPLPWPGVVFGIFLLSAWYFCTNQVLVQRSLAAKNVTHAKAASILAGYFKILPMFLMIYPGMISRALWPDLVACQDPEICDRVCNNPNGCSDIAYPRMVLKLMPTGLRGLMLAAMLAALMSSLTSIFNSASTIFTLDCWVKIRPTSTELELVMVGRLVTLILVVVSVLWIPFIQAYGSGELFIYIQSMTSYFSPPMFAVYVLAMFWERMNEPGAFYGMIGGFAVGTTRMLMDLFYGVPGCGDEDNRPPIVANLHYLHFACVLFGITLVLSIFVALITQPIPRRKIIRLTWWTRFSKVPREAMDEEEEQQDEKNELIKLEKEKQIAKDASGDLSFTRKLWNMLCGISSLAPPEISPEDKLRAEQKMTTIVEPRKWKIFAAANAILLCGAGVFVFAYFG
ncbi:sodium/glucose cotransporter 4-like isoform X2 [Amphiura filiformis]